MPLLVIRLLLVCIVSVPAMGLVASAEPQLAKAACSTNPRPSQIQAGNWHVGMDNYAQTTVGGVYGQLENQAPYVYPSSMFNFSAAYVLIGVPGMQNYAQVGWIQRRNGERNTFVQGVGPNGNFLDNKTLSPYAVGSFIYYSVLYNNVPNKFTFYSNNAYLGIQMNATFVPTRGEIAGEINNKASQMPGGYADGLGIYDAQIWTFGAWRDFQGFMFGESEWGKDPPSGYAYYNGTQAYIWDTLCP